jgi:hypothetical protein
MDNVSSFEISDLQKKLEYEMIHSDHINDLNVQLKLENQRLKDRLKVVVLPTSLAKLQALAQEQDNLIRRLRRAMASAIDMIPETEGNRDDKNELRKLYDHIA